MLIIQRDFYAYLDEMKTVTVLLPHSYFEGHSSAFYMKEENKEKVPLAIRERHSLPEQNKYICSIDFEPQLDRTYYIEDEHGNETDLQVGAVIRTHEFDEKYFYEGNDLGVTLDGGRTIFKVWAPTATKVKVKITWSDMNSSQQHDMTRGEKGVWAFSLEGDADGCFYTYLTCINLHWQEAVDPYAKSVSLNSEWGAVVNMGKTVQAIDSLPALESKTDSIIYELHIRDFSVHEESGMKHKGAYLAFTETGTRTSNGLTTGVDYLDELGITHVELLPVNDFEGVSDLRDDGRYNWGYNPLNFNAPEGSYSSRPQDPYSRINELKEVIHSLHSRGIRVIMDVVYNHVYIKEESSFEKIVPGYYFRYDENGMPSNGTGVGNDMASERKMVRKFILDSVRYWLKEFKVDGLRFDLMGILDVETMNLVHEEAEKILPNALIIGEGWNLNTPLPQSMKANIRNAGRMQGISQFNDSFRDGIKGSTFNLYDRGFALGHSGLEKRAAEVLTGSIGLTGESGLFLHPAQTVNYVESHDNHTLWDKISACCPDEAEREKRHMLATSMVLLSQGIAFLHAGQEFLRTKEGVENSYKSPDEINQLDWHRRTIYQNKVEYIKGLIAIRKAHGAFRFSQPELIRKHIQADYSSPGVVKLHLNNIKAYGPWNEIFILFHAGESQLSVSLPLGETPWKLISDGESAGLQALDVLDGGMLKADPVSCYVCCR
ncbi:type I pullulanase [Rossellomorea vietnamensis]|uniref:Type I pullulanase n=1 Tax=Rossellomorea vietnamensis TaxID=218284 RepID=A0A5D4M9B4_9BACI|nr:type I pullulanase [Rossellomorea vietnamensis]TYR98252.1 type I pullulanase [Rossellomorea vietnamensis]